VVLGDNILGGSIRDARERFEKKPESALILLTEVQSPEAFGVALLKGGKIVAIEEKPENPDSQFAIPGIYFFPKDVFQIAGGVNPSARGEYEVTDILCEYLRQGRLEYQMLTHWWVDAGTHESLAEAKQLIRRDGVWQEKDWVA
jgi:glucose-1-phosphate thymidylyltransferase